MLKAPKRGSVTATPSAARRAAPGMVPGDEARLSFVDWEAASPVQGLPYEWYRLRKTRFCGSAGGRADSVLVVWLPDEALNHGFFTTLTSVSQGLVCQETTTRECHLTASKPPLVRLDPALQRAVSFKIIGPRASSALWGT